GHERIDPDEPGTPGGDSTGALRRRGQSARPPRADARTAGGAAPGQGAILHRRSCRNPRQGGIHRARVVPTGARSRQETPLRPGVGGGVDDRPRRIGPDPEPRPPAGGMLLTHAKGQTPWAASLRSASTTKSWRGRLIRSSFSWGSTTYQS